MFSNYRDARSWFEEKKKAGVRTYGEGAEFVGFQAEDLPKLRDLLVISVHTYRTKAKKGSVLRKRIIDIYEIYWPRWISERAKAAPIKRSVRVPTGYYEGRIDWRDYPLNSAVSPFKMPFARFKAQGHYALDNFSKSYYVVTDPGGDELRKWAYSAGAKGWAPYLKADTLTYFPKTEQNYFIPHQVFDAMLGSAEDVYQILDIIRHYPLTGYNRLPDLWKDRFKSAVKSAIIDKANSLGNVAFLEDAATIEQIAIDSQRLVASIISKLGADAPVIQPWYTVKGDPLKQATKYGKMLFKISLTQSDFNELNSYLQAVMNLLKNTQLMLEQRLAYLDGLGPAFFQERNLDPRKNPFLRYDLKASLAQGKPVFVNTAENARQITSTRGIPEVQGVLNQGQQVVTPDMTNKQMQVAVEALTNRERNPFTGLSIDDLVKYGAGGWVNPVQEPSGLEKALPLIIGGAVAAVALTQGG